MPMVGLARAAGPVNVKMSHAAFMTNRERALDSLNPREPLHVVDGYPRRDPAPPARKRPQTIFVFDL